MVLLSVLPSDRGPWVAQTTIGINRGLAARYGQPGSPITYIDLTKIFTLPSGLVDPGKFIDPKLSPPQPSLHPSPQGMAELCAAIEPTLAKWI